MIIPSKAISQSVIAGKDTFIEKKPALIKNLSFLEIMEPISTKDFSNNEYLFVKNLLKKPQFNDFFNQMQEKNGNLKNLENEEHLKVYEKDNIKNTEGFINLLESEIKKIDSDKRNIEESLMQTFQQNVYEEYAKENQKNDKSINTFNFKQTQSKTSDKQQRKNLNINGALATNSQKNFYLNEIV